MAEISNPLEQQWVDLKDKVQDGIAQHFPLESSKRSLVLHGISFDEKEAAIGDIRSQEEAKLAGRTWGVPVRADVSLVDKETGKTIDRSEIRLLTLPKPTNRYSYIVDGTERQSDSLWRLRSGVYANVQQNGKMRAEFNLAKPFARESRLYIPFDQEKKKFKFQYGMGGATPLYPVLKMMGVQDEEMKKAWGEDIYKANATDNVQHQIMSFYDKKLSKRVKSDKNDYDSVASAITKEFDKTELLPETTKASLGKPFTKVNGEVMLLASKKILNVARGEEAPEDRDSLTFKGLYGIDDFLHEKLTHDKTRRTVKAKISNNLDRLSKVREIIPVALFADPIREHFSKSSTSRIPDQTNPLDMLVGGRITTIIAAEEGGMKQEHSVTPAMKVINPSHLGFLDPVHTPESSRTGITLHLPMGVKKVGNEAKAVIYDLKEHKIVHVTPSELHNAFVALPDQVTWKDQKPHPIADLVKMKDPTTHEFVEKPFKDARYLFVSPHQLFNESTNLIPFLQNNQGNRTMTGARQATQAVGLLHREAPLVQVKSGGERSWEHITGIPWAHTAPADGKVVEITKNKDNGYTDTIHIQDKEGTKHALQLYNNFPLNMAKTFIHSDPSVAVGDVVKKGQVVADSNFTKNGDLALGNNLLVSYLPYKGLNFEDGIVISDVAAKKLTSEHLHRKGLELNPEQGDQMSLDVFQTFASTQSKSLPKESFSKLGKDGVIRMGSKVMQGDILIAAVGKKEASGETQRTMSRLDSKLFSRRDKSVSWESEYPGEVVKIVKHPNDKGATVFVRTLEPAQVGDKLVGRHGNKGIISRVLSDEAMPRIGGPEGKPVEILLSPSGVPSRINLGQMLETAASKIAEKTGKPFMVNNFGKVGVDHNEYVQEELKKHGLTDTESLYDPETKKKLGEVLTGKQYIMKLTHQVEKKLHVRSHGQGYTIDHAPSGTGSEHPGQSIGQLDFYSLLAHGARHNLREIATYKADQNLDENFNERAHLDFWDRVRMGLPLPPPQPTFAYKKFEGYLTALGINLKKTGNELQLTPLTDKGVLKMSAGEITDPGLYLRGKDNKELAKGLFDPKLTGGLPNDVNKGKNWTHITLAEPLPNPIFVGSSHLQPGPAVILSGLNYKDFNDVVRGAKYIDGKTGGVVIENLLKKIDIKKELQTTKDQLTKARGNDLNRLNTKAKYLIALDQLGLKANEAYIVHHVPVLPPIFRPVTPMEDGSYKYEDINHYYSGLGLVNNQLKTPIKELPDETNQHLREQMWDLMQATAGVGGKPVYNSNREMRGILDSIKGTQPKFGMFQKRIMKRRQELSMASTIIPEPALHLDSVGIPKDAAMELYKPFVVREFVAMGYSPTQAYGEMKKSSPVAITALQKAVDKRPLRLKRDPVLHKFSTLAFRPQLVEGKAIQIHPLVTAGFNADFDGDSMAVHVPLTDQAVEETWKMLPSNNLFSPTHGGIMYAPSQDSLVGLNLLSKWGKTTDHKFSNFNAAKAAYDKGKITVTDVIKVGGKDITFGRLLIGKQLPAFLHNDKEFAKQLQNPKFEIVKNTSEKEPHLMGVKNILERVAKTEPTRFPDTVDNLKNLGNQFSYELGFSFGLKDLNVPKKIRAEVLAPYEAAAKKVHASTSLSDVDKKQKLVDIYENATKDLTTRLKPHFAEKQNRMYQMVSSGARGDWDQFRQMNIAPMLMKDGLGNTIHTPVLKSYSEGLDVGDYWTTLHGARMGTLQRVEGTSKPGDLTKGLVNLLMPNLIISHDCGTNQGIHLDIHDRDVHDRVLVNPIKIGNHEVGKAGDIVTPELTSLLKKHKIDKVLVRSPLKCTHGIGMCAKCFGLNENGEFHNIGTNIGVIAGQSLGEPATQLAMNSFHTGGVSASKGGGSVDQFTRLTQLLDIPKILPGAATLASTSGKVEKVVFDKGTNGHHVWIGGAAKPLYIPAQRKVFVKAGDDVKRGNPLSDGNINPRHLLEHTDIHTVQNYITDELQNSIYRDARVRRRNIETVVRSLTNLTKVTDPGSSTHLHGDTALRTVVEEHNRGLKAGEKPILHKPLLKSTEQVALDQHEDWMARLNFRRLHQTVLEGTSKGWKTNVHGTNPVAAFAFGAEFGLSKEKGKEHHY